MIDVRDQLSSKGARMLGHGKPVLLLQPKYLHGTLVELEQV